MGTFVFWSLFALSVYRSGDMAVLVARLALQAPGRLWSAWLAGAAACLLFVWQAIPYLFAFMPAASATVAFGVSSFLYVAGGFWAEPYVRRAFLKLDQTEERRLQKDARDRLLNESDDYREAKQTVARLETDMGITEWKDAKQLVDELINNQLPKLVRRRHNLTTEERHLRARSEQAYDQLVLSRGTTREEKNRAAVIAARASHQQTLSAIAQVAERIDATKDALAHRIFIFNERQIDETPETTRNANHPLVEALQANDDYLFIWPARCARAY